MCAACAAGPTRVVRVAAPAKVNLYLGVHREPDERGYHLVDSVMASLGLADEVEVAPARELSVVCDPDAGCPARKNTCWKAVEAMDAEFGVGTGFSTSGFGFGFVSYAAVKLLSGRVREVSLFMWIITAMFLINFFMRG